MRSVMWVGRGVIRATRTARSISVPALLLAVLAVLAVGCGGHENSGPALPVSHAGASDTQISGESLLPGDQRVPGALATSVTTRPGFLGIGKPSLPVPPAASRQAPPASAPALIVPR